MSFIWAALICFQLEEKMEGWKHKGGLGWPIFGQLCSVSISCYWEKMLRAIPSLFSDRLTARVEKEKKKRKEEKEAERSRWTDEILSKEMEPAEIDFRVAVVFNFRPVPCKKPRSIGTETFPDVCQRRRIAESVFSSLPSTAIIQSDCCLIGLLCIRVILIKWIQVRIAVYFSVLSFRPIGKLNQPIFGQS